MNQPVNSGRNLAFCLGCVVAGGAGNLRDEFGAAVLQHFRRAIKNLSAIVGRCLAPAVPGCTGRDDCVAEILA
jgi:hypothetical protein